MEVTDIACGCDTTAAMADGCCGPDVAGVVDVIDVGCGLDDVEHSLHTDHWSDRHTCSFC